MDVVGTSIVGTFFAFRDSLTRRIIPSGSIPVFSWTNANDSTNSTIPFAKSGCLYLAFSCLRSSSFLAFLPSKRLPQCLLSFVGDNLSKVVGDSLSMLTAHGRVLSCLRGLRRLFGTLKSSELDSPWVSITGFGLRSGDT